MNFWTKLTSYPYINYNSASHYPDRYIGQNCYFVGNVLQTIPGANVTQYRMNIDRQPGVVIVTINNNDKTIDPVDGASLRVYGEYGGNRTYQTTWGTSTTMLTVIAHEMTY